MCLSEPLSIPSAVEMLLDYHRLLRIVKEECCIVLDDDSTRRLIALIHDHIQELELPAAVQLQEARETRGCSN
jgi:hypothetical protein